MAGVANSSAAFWIGLAAEISGLLQGHMVLKGMYGDYEKTSASDGWMPYMAAAGYAAWGILAKYEVIPQD